MYKESNSAVQAFLVTLKLGRHKATHMYAKVAPKSFFFNKVIVIKVVKNRPRRQHQRRRRRLRCRLQLLQLGQRSRFRKVSPICKIEKFCTLHIFIKTTLSLMNVNRLKTLATR
jgi:hypothetical protein